MIVKVNSGDPLCFWLSCYKQTKTDTSGDSFRAHWTFVLQIFFVCFLTFMNVETMMAVNYLFIYQYRAFLRSKVFCITIIIFNHVERLRGSVFCPRTLEQERQEMNLQPSKHGPSTYLCITATVSFLSFL